MKKGTDSAKGWWYARFRMRWPQDSEPSWHIDLLLAHRLIAPVLNRFSRDISLWRFHRRAVRDEEGHQFSFIFYSSLRTGQQMTDALKSNKLLQKLIRSGVIIQDLYQDTARIYSPGIGDTSDSHWSPPVKNTWPFFIMGVCQMWLSLIDETAAHTVAQTKTPSVPRMIEFYEKVNDAIQLLWREQGSHALLHHLNAIFGYEPLLVREIQLKTF
jgi:hypothetical protein